MNFDTENVKVFKEVLDSVVDTCLQKKGITSYIASKVTSVNENGTINAYILPDKTKVVSNLLNKTGESLSVGDSIEICTKNGKLSNAWVSLKHGTNVSGGGGSGGVNIINATTSTSASTADKVATTSGGNYNPSINDVVSLIFTNANTANEATLDIDGSGAKPIKLNGSTSTSTWLVGGDGGTTYLIYDGTSYNVFGSQRNIDNNTSHRVGDIIHSTSATNPSEAFGGTWVAITDKFLIGAGASYTGGATGGSADAIVVSHTHIQNAHSHLATSRTTTYGQGYQDAWRCMSFVGTNSDFAQNVYTSDTTATNQSTGVSGTNANLPPYLAVYMWYKSV